MPDSAKVGDSVSLKVPSPKMIVVYQQGTSSQCAWFTQAHEQKTAWFPTVSLTVLAPAPRRAADEIDDDWISDQVSHALRDAEQESTVTTLGPVAAPLWIARRAEQIAVGYVRERYRSVPDDEMTIAVLREMAEQLLEDNAHLLRDAAETDAKAQATIHGASACGACAEIEKTGGQWSAHHCGKAEVAEIPAAPGAPPDSNPMHAFGMGRGD